MTAQKSTFAPSPKDGSGFRATIGIMCVSTGIIGLGLLFFVNIPPRNENALLLALGIVLGWGGAVVASEYGASTTGRRAADAAINNMTNDQNDRRKSDATK